MIGLNKEVRIIYNHYNDETVNSQAIVQKNYIQVLNEAGYHTILIGPRWLDKVNSFIGASEVVALDYNDKKYPSVPNTELLKYLVRTFDNKNIYYNFQSGTAFDIYTYLYEPRFRYPKIINHFIEGYGDYSFKDPRTIKRINGVTYLPTIFNSMHTMMEFSKMAKSGQLAILGQKYINLGIELEKLCKIKSEKYKEFTWIFPGNALLSVKNLELFFKVFDKLYETGRKFKVKMYLAENFIPKAPVRDYLEVSKSLPQEEFWKEASKCHAFLATSKSESYGMAYWELMALGLVGIFYKQQWNMETGSVNLLGAYKPTELLTYVIETMDNYDDTLMKSSGIWGTIKDKHDRGSCNREFLDIFNLLLKSQ